VRDVYIVGVAQTPVTKGTTVRCRDLGASVIRAALQDAGLSGDRVAALYVGNMMSGILGRQQQLGALLADEAGLNGIEAVTVEAACASGGAAARLAYLAVAGGMHEVVVVCGVERMTHVDHDTVTRALATAADWELEGACGESFLSLNAKLMRAYMDAYGLRSEDFAPFSIAAHRNALTNPNALFHKNIDLDAYLASRLVADPLRLFDASPICDGAAAVVLAAGPTATAVIAAQDRPGVRIAGSAAATAALAPSRRDELLPMRAVERSTGLALQQAVIRHRDVDLFELHDAYTIMTLLSLESAGFAAPGKAAKLAVDGGIGLDGGLPIATLGGLKARGHPVGATGVYQLVEACAQLAGLAGPNQVAGAKNALVQNIGGTGATVVTHALQRAD
jgi:acetyl-CoA C-acetyltransferase